ncbi:MAG: ParB/RepB/Spo0J family partition protein [Clostridiales bacterium]|jgi:ParB family chromosome partitioning protein|nr:ParB/RepB/Spo0J family partition protein [Clostridiales bacterium]
MKNQKKIESGGHILLIPQEDIVPNPSQPRRRFDSDELEGLADSIKHNGIIQPINVRASADGKYELIAGERRLRASRIVGLTRVPCILMEASDEKSAIYALLENLQRQDLGFFEEANAIKQLMDRFSMTQEEVAKILGKAQSTLSNKLRLLRLSEEIREIIVKNDLTERHARALLRLENEGQLNRALSIIVDRHLNVAETDRLIEQMLNNRAACRKPINKVFKDVRIFVNTLNHAVNTMRQAGIDADSVKSETEEYIEYVVRIPKCKGFVVKSHNQGA